MAAKRAKRAATTGRPAKKGPVKAAKKGPVKAAKKGPVKAAKKGPVKAAKKAPAKAAKKAPVKSPGAVVKSAPAAAAPSKPPGSLKRFVQTARTAITTLVKIAARGSTRKANRSESPLASRLSARKAGKTVDAYIAGLPEAQRDAAVAIRAIVREAVPDASESIKWGQPVYEHGGPFAYIKAAKAHLTFGFWRGTELTDPDGLLQGAGDLMRHLKVTGGATVPTDAIRAFVEQAVRLNAERGDPTRRG